MKAETKQAALASALVAVIFALVLAFGHRIGRSTAGQPGMESLPEKCDSSKWGTKESVDDLRRRLSRGLPASPCDLDQLAELAWELDDCAEASLVRGHHPGSATW